MPRGIRRIFHVSSLPYKVYERSLKVKISVKCKISKAAFIFFSVAFQRPVADPILMSSTPQPRRGDFASNGSTLGGARTSQNPSKPPSTVNQITKVTKPAQKAGRKRLKKWACPCGKSYQGKLDLEAHMNTWGGTWSFQCPVDECLKPFAKSTEANMHIMRAAGLGTPHHEVGKEPRVREFASRLESM